MKVTTLEKVRDSLRDGKHRITVEPDLTLRGRPEVLVLGDMVRVSDGAGGTLPLPGVAQPAIQEGKYVAGVIRARLAGGQPPPPFRYRDLGMMAVIGRSQAVADLFGRIRVGGFPAFMIWGVVHLAYLVGWGNRFEAVARWMWTILARNRRERLITMASLAGDESGLEELHDPPAAPAVS